MELLKHTLFINLNERVDRLIHASKEFKKLGINAERFNALKMKNGAIGCTMSHLKCLELARSRNYPHVFICEDDIAFTDPNVFMNNLQKFHETYKNNWDVIIVGGNNVPPYDKCSEYCIKVSNCQTTTGYIVNASYYDVLISNIKEGLQLFLKNQEKKKEYAIDIYWKKLQQTDKWYMIIPATVIQYSNYSDIEERETDYSVMLTDIDKDYLFRPMQFHNMTYFSKAGGSYKM